MADLVGTLLLGTLMGMVVNALFWGWLAASLHRLFRTLDPEAQVELAFVRDRGWSQARLEAQSGIHPAGTRPFEGGLEL